MTDAQGRYELTQLSAGRYQLKARRGGYVDVEYGQRRPFERGRPVELATAPCSRTSTSPSRLARSSPAASSTKSARRSPSRPSHSRAAGTSMGPDDWSRQTGSSTDDRGEFRIFGVPPGDYVILARFEGMDLGSRDRVRYVPTYYPRRRSRAKRSASPSPPAGGAGDHDRAGPRDHRNRARNRPVLRPRLERPIRIRDRSRFGRPGSGGPDGDGHPRRRRIVRAQRTAAGHLPRGGAIADRIGLRGEGGRRRWLRRERRHPGAVERRDSTGAGSVSTRAIRQRIFGRPRSSWVQPRWSRGRTWTWT
jgi:hypothetical protein